MTLCITLLHAVGECKSVNLNSFIQGKNNFLHSAKINLVELLVVLNEKTKNPKHILIEHAIIMLLDINSLSNTLTLSL